MASAAGLRAKGLGTPLTIEIDEVADLLEQTNGAFSSILQRLGLP